MDKPRQPQMGGIAKLFSEAQIRDFFIRYISLIIVVEIFLLLIMLCGSVAVYKEPFPTQLYLILALSLPLGITFLLGVFVIAFNKYVFGNDQREEDDETEENAGPGGWFSKGDPILRKIYKIPFVAKIFLLVLIIPVLFSVDDMMRFYASIGAQTVRYLLMGIMALIGTAAVAGITWMVVSYRLKNKQMDYEYRYRKDIMDKLQLVVLDNDKLVDRNGKVISIKAPEPTGDNPQIVDGDYEICSLPMDKEAVNSDRTTLS